MTQPGLSSRKCSVYHRCDWRLTKNWIVILDWGHKISVVIMYYPLLELVRTIKVQLYGNLSTGVRHKEGNKHHLTTVNTPHLTHHPGLGQIFNHLEVCSITNRKHTIIPDSIEPSLIKYAPRHLTVPRGVLYHFWIVSSVALKIYSVSQKKWEYWEMETRSAGTNM